MIFSYPRKFPSSFIAIIAVVCLVNNSGCSNNQKPTMIPPSITVVGEVNPTELFRLIATITPVIAPHQPEYTPTPISIGEINFVDHHHPDGLYNLQIPEYWLTRDYPSSSTIADPNNSVVLNIEVYNVGYEIDFESLSKFSSTREKQLFGSYDYYYQVNEEKDLIEGKITIEKAFMHNSEDKSARTIYSQLGSIIFVIDFWAKEMLFDPYLKTIEYIADSIDIHVERVSSLDLYAFGNDSKLYNDDFSIQIPKYWTQTQTLGPYSKVVTLSSPDELAVIQTITYDDGGILSPSVSGEFVLRILQDQYTNDLYVLSDRLKDGREHIVWIAFYSDYQGATIYEMNNTTISILTVMWENDASDIYQEILESVIDSYSKNMD